MKKEIWKDIPEFNGVYQASTLGRIRSVDRMVLVVNPAGGRIYEKKNKGVILRVEKDKNGFNYVRLYKEGVKVKLQNHRLVAITFLDNPKGCKFVKFKDGDRDNPEVTNLEWTNKRRW